MNELLHDTGITIMELDEYSARLARDAYMRFGKASGHPAKLNFGDCFSYALAKSRNDLLLYKGNDFSKTDIHVASY